MYMALYCWRLFSKSLESLGYVMKQSELFGSPAMVWALFMLGVNTSYLGVNSDAHPRLFLDAAAAAAAGAGGVSGLPCRGVISVSLSGGRVYPCRG